MKTTLILICLIAFTSITNAQTEAKTKLKIQTFLIKSKKGDPQNQVNYYLNINEFNQKFDHLKLKKNMKLDDRIYVADKNTTSYFFENETDPKHHKVLCDVAKVEGEKCDYRLKFFTACLPEKPFLGKYQFIYQVKEDFCYAITLKSDEKHSYLFLVSPGEQKAEKDNNEILIVSTSNNTIIK